MSKFKKIGYDLLNTITPLTRPTDVEDRSKMSILLFNQSTLDTIVNTCKPKAGASEFQVHYRALVIKAVKNEVELIITIPTTFYNFPQKVSSASVDYDLVEVAQAGTAAQQLSGLLASQWASKLQIINDLKTAGAEVTVIESDCGSIHRHPGDFGFSSTDYDKNPKNPGIIYRNKEAIDHAQTDSVIYIPHVGSPKIVVTETRIVNVFPDGDGIDGTYTEIPTFTIVKQDSSTVASLSFEDLLGELETSIEPVNYKLVESMGKLKHYKLVDSLIEEYITTDFIEPNLLLVDPANITSNYTQYGSTTKYNPTTRKWEKITPDYNKPQISAKTKEFYGEFYDYDY